MDLLAPLCVRHKHSRMMLSQLIKLSDTWTRTCCYTEMKPWLSANRYAPVTQLKDYPDRGT